MSSGRSADFAKERRGHDTSVLVGMVGGVKRERRDWLGDGLAIGIGFFQKLRKR